MINSVIASADQDPGSSSQVSVISRVAAFFTSVKTAIVLLFLLAAASVFGTIIPQDIPLDQLQHMVSPFYYRLMVILDLHKLYRSWWFLLLLILLSLNIVGCLLARLKSIPAEWTGNPEKSLFTISRSDARSPRELQEAIVPAVKQVVRGSPRLVETTDGVTLLWVNDRLQLLGFPFIHAAIILILLGGLIGAVYGVKGKVEIKEGQKENRFTVLPSGETAKLPFDIAVDKFSLTRYPTGEPKEFRSDVRLLVADKEALEGSIFVNHPLTFQGISLYQSDYRIVSIKEVKFRVVNPSDQDIEFTLRLRAASPLPGTDYQLHVVGLDLGSAKRPAAVEISVQSPNEPARSIKLFQDDPNPIKLGDSEIRFLNFVPLYMTGLQIGYDPGSGLVWAGCILLLFGFFLTLFTDHRRLEVGLTSTGAGTSIRISGRSKKARREFRENVKRVIDDALGGSSQQPI
ncbi:MAG TPA: cytochrome c biogenesis protein ResB [Desulfomonilaceae bacterium]|nr:cytochrome c biogenesis protein ResB [Desulfomonilaceae bacterium]